MKKPCYLNVTRYKRKIYTCDIFRVVESERTYFYQIELVSHGCNWKEYLKENSWHKR